MRQPGRESERRERRERRPSAGKRGFGRNARLAEWIIRPRRKIVRASVVRNAETGFEASAGNKPADHVAGVLRRACGKIGAQTVKGLALLGRRSARDFDHLGPHVDLHEVETRQGRLKLEGPCAIATLQQLARRLDHARKPTGPEHRRRLQEHLAPRVLEGDHEKLTAAGNSDAPLGLNKRDRVPASGAGGVQRRAKRLRRQMVRRERVVRRRVRRTKSAHAQNDARGCPAQRDDSANCLL